MKPVMLLLLLFSFEQLCAQEAVNAMGEINFGMSQKEVKQTYRKAKESYYLHFGQHYFTPTVIGSKFLPGLHRLSFKHSMQDGSTGANNREAAELCLLMEEYYKKQNGKITWYNPNYPIAKHMVGSTVFIVEFEDKVIRPFVNTSIEDATKVWEYIFGIDIMTIEYYNSRALQYKRAEKSGK